MGKQGDYTLPSTLSGISDYAFKECSITRFIFPDSFSEIGQGALMNSKVEEARPTQADSYGHLPGMHPVEGGKIRQED